MLKKIDVKVMIAIAVLLLGAIYLFVSGKMGNPLAGASEVGFEGTGIKVTYDYSSNLNCYATDNGFFFCSKDGIKFVTSKGDTKFDYTLNMSAPVLAGEGSYAAVAEGGGKTLYVFSEDGLMYTKSYDEAIVSFSVNKIGFVSAVIKNNNDYNVYVYNTSGDFRTNAIFQDKNVFPVAAEISPDGDILAVSAVNINSISVQSDILFYYTREDAAGSLADGVFGTVTGLADQLIGKLQFMADDYLIAISGSHITSVASSSDYYLETKWSFEFDNEIAHVAFPDDRTAAVALGAPIVNRESGYTEGTILFFDIEEGLAAEYDPGWPVTYLSGGLGSVIVGGGNIGRTFTAVTSKGRALWNYTATQDVKEILFLNKTDKIIFVSPLQLEVLELKRVQRSPGATIETDFEDNSDIRPDRNSGSEEQESEEEEELPLLYEEDQPQEENLDNFFDNGFPQEETPVTENEENENIE